MKKFTPAIIFFISLLPCFASAQGLTVNIVTIRNVLCYGDSTASIYAAATGGTGYTYAWSNGLVTDTINDVPAGNYSVTVLSAQLETGSATATVSQPQSAVTVSAGSTPISACGARDGAVFAIANGGTPGYSYPWSNGLAGDTVLHLAVGFYSVTATDLNGCTASALVNVNSPASLSIEMNSTPEDCYGDMVGTASANAINDTFALFYNWNNGDTGQTITELAAGTYIVTVTDVTGCSKAASVDVTQPAPISFITSSTPSTCGQSTGTASVSVTGGSGTYTYLWSTESTSAQLTGLSEGYYTVNVFQGNCTVTGAAAVGNSNGPSITMPFTTPSCPGGSDGTVRALVTGGTPPYSFLWIPGASTDSVITGIAADIWKVIVTDHHNCTATNSINVPEPSDFEVYPYVFDATCNGSSNGSATVSVTGGTAPYSYKWSNQSRGPVLMNASDNTYTVTITDANQCTFLSSVVVIQPLPLQVNTTVTNSSGSNGTATASVSGGTTPYSYSWSNEESAPVDTDLAPSQYSITVTDANGCTAFATVTVPFGVGIAAIGNGLFNFSVFPNPSSGLVGLEFSCTSGVMRGEISIADLSGRIVYREQETIEDRVQKILDANSFSPGLYTVQLSAGGCSLRQKLIIAR